MLTSLDTKEIAGALLKAQAEFPVIAFDSDNPYFHSRFASLGACISATRPILVKHGLTVVQMPTNGDNGTVGVTTRLEHNPSGQWYQDTITIPLQKASEKTQIAQIAGIAITYLRRYSYNAILGLYAEEDSDGGVYDGYEKAPRQVKPSSTSKFKGKKGRPAKVKEIEEVDEVEAAGSPPSGPPAASCNSPPWGKSPKT